MQSESIYKTESFSIALILKSSSNQPDYQPLYQESFVLIKAASLEEAKIKALNHGKSNRQLYK